MVWVSNRSSDAITVSITTTSGGSNATFTVYPSVSLGPAADVFTDVKQESTGDNLWGRNGPETLTVTIGGNVKSFPVQKDDHVTFYSDAYEIYTSQVTRIPWGLEQSSELNCLWWCPTLPRSMGCTNIPNFDRLIWFLTIHGQRKTADLRIHRPGRFFGLVSSLLFYHHFPTRIT